MARSSGWSPFLLACLLLLPARGAAQVAPGQTDTFEGGAENWFIGGGPTGVPPTAPAVVTTGGPHGVGDAFLNLVSSGGIGSGSRLTASNAAQWSGDYLAAGVGRIGMWVNNFGTTDLFLRLAFESLGAMGPTDIAFSADPIFVGALSGWTQIVFPIWPGALLSHPLLPGSTVEGALTNVSLLRLYHSPDDNSPNPFVPIPAVAADLGVDDVTALATTPEPATTLLLGFGLLGVVGAACLRRRARA
jgi:hypothetical protein